MKVGFQAVGIECWAGPGFRFPGFAVELCGLGFRGLPGCGR